MARRNRRRTSEARPLSGAFADRRSESGPDGDWIVQTVSGTSSAKGYRCPGCDQEIRSGTAHIVAWPKHAGADLRRHWHTPCWSARLRRR